MSGIDMMERSLRALCFLLRSNLLEDYASVSGSMLPLQESILHAAGAPCCLCFTIRFCAFLGESPEYCVLMLNSCAPSGGLLALLDLSDRKCETEPGCILGQALGRGETLISKDLAQ